MRQLGKFTRACLVLVLALTFTQAALVSAQASMSGESSSGSSSTGETSTAEQAKQKAEQAREAARQAQQQAKDAKQNAREAAQNSKSKTVEELQKRCQARKSHATTTFRKMSHNSTEVLARINSIYEKALQYQTANNLAPAGINDLITTANANKASAANAVKTLQDTTPTMDCTSSSVVNDLNTYKTNAQHARDELKQYRSSVKAVLKALRETKASTSPEGIAQ